jgi:hypothetical protein
MKTIKIFLLVILMGGLASCTPNTLKTEKKAQNIPSIYGTGGEHSTGPDNVKD